MKIFVCVGNDTQTLTSLHFVSELLQQTPAWRKHLWFFVINLDQPLNFDLPPYSFSSSSVSSSSQTATAAAAQQRRLSLADEDVSLSTRA
jgi:hypothetical protein